MEAFFRNDGHEHDSSTLGVESRHDSGTQGVESEGEDAILVLPESESEGDAILVLTESRVRDKTQF